MEAGEGAVELHASLDEATTKSAECATREQHEQREARHTDNSRTVTAQLVIARSFGSKFYTSRSAASDATVRVGDLLPS